MLSSHGPGEGINKALSEYLDWNGRYISNFLTYFSPVHGSSLLHYQLVPIILILLGVLSIYWLLLQITFGAQFSKKQLWLLSMLITLFYLWQMADIAQGIYWYASSSAYFAGNIFCLFQLGLFIRLISKDRLSNPFLSHLVSLVILFVSIGFNETGMAFMFIFYFLLYVFLLFKKSSKKNIVLLYLMVSVLGGFLMVLAPGNEVRFSNFHQNMNLFYSLGWSLMQSLRFGAEWVSSLPLIFFSLIALAGANLFEKTVLAKTDVRFLLLIIGSILFFSSFLPYWATGLLGQHRTINFAFFFFIFAWFSFIISVSLKYKIHVVLSIFLQKEIIFYLTLASLLIIISTKNGYKVSYDIIYGNHKKYLYEQLMRQKIILQNPNTEICYIPPLLNRPQSLFVMDVESGNFDWRDYCICNYYGNSKSEIK